MLYFSLKSFLEIKIKEYLNVKDKKNNMFEFQLNFTNFFDVFGKSIIFYCISNFIPKSLNPTNLLFTIQYFFVILGIPAIFLFLRKGIYRVAEDILEEKVFLKIFVYILISLIIFLLALRNPFFLDGYVTMLVFFVFGVSFIAYLVSLAVISEQF